MRAPPCRMSDILELGSADDILDERVAEGGGEGERREEERVGCV